MTTSPRRIRITPEQLLGPIGRTHWDDNGFAERVVKECGEPLVVLEGIASHSALAVGQKARISPFWGDGTGALKGLMLGRVSTYAALKAVNEALEPFDLELLLVEAFRSARMQAGGFSDVFWRPDGGKPADPSTVLGWSFEKLLERSHAARKGYLENGIVEDERYKQSMAQLLEGGRKREILALTEKLGKPAPTVAKWIVKYLANLLGGDYALLNVAGNRPHGTGVVVDAVLMRKSTGLPVYMGAPSDDTGDGMRLKTLHFFEENSYQAFIEELERDSISKMFVADFAPEYGTEGAYIRHYEDAKRHRRLLANAMFLIAGAGGYNVDDTDGEYWHFTVPAQPEGLGDPTWMVLNNRTEPAIFGSAFAHQSAAAIVGAEFVY